jgi:SWI/SNF-related matrix-associated actin-dependent regulator of chromatin subfamily A-like protein 1
MNITYERYTDNYGARIALNKIPFNLKDDMKAHMGWPQFSWNGEKGLWTIQDRADVIEKAIAFLADHDITVEGLEYDESAIDISSSATATYTAPDQLVLKWDFQPNWKDINAAMKDAAAGNAKWQGNTKTWMIPVATAMAVANAVRPHFEPLADAIENNEQVQLAHAATLQRVELSSAVETDIELPDKEPFISLRPYQRIAPVMFMSGGRQRILIADEMGLGKSLQALACVELADYQHVLIVCPSIVKHNWDNEIRKWIYDDAYMTEIIKGREGTIENARFHIINYDILGARLDQLMAWDYDCIIFDEVHRIKNPKTATTKAALKLAQGKQGIIALSGTPITNRPIEFFTSLNMMMPATFANYFTFAKKYCNARKTDFGWDMSGSSNIDTSRDGITTPLNHILRDFMLRRSMDDPRIAGEMPDLVETIINLDLPEEALKQYKLEYNSWMEEWQKQQANFGSTDAGFTLNMMTQLRHIAGRLKVDAAVKWATTYLETNGKPLVIFAHHNDVISRLLARLNKEKRRAYCIEGKTNPHARRRSIKEFQEGKIDFLICSTNAMREGVNLHRANTTLFVEREWVPAWEQQAAARVRRMTQEASTCHKVVLSANNTIDALFDQVVAEKADLVQRTLDGDSGTTRDAIGKALLKKLKTGKGSMI